MFYVLEPVHTNLNKYVFYSNRNNMIVDPTVDNLEGGFKTFYLTNFNGVFDSVPLSWVHVKVDRSMIQPYMVWFGIYGQKTAKISLFQ